MAPIDDAIDSYNAQLDDDPEDQLSIRDLARLNGVNHATLARRVSGRSRPRSQAHIHRQVLAPNQEAALVDYISRTSLMGHPPPIGNHR